MRSQIGRIHAKLGPLLRGEGPQLAGEPGVEHVLVLARCGTARRTRIDAVNGGVLPAALVAVVHGNTMTPPQLTRDAPVLQVGKPIQVNLLPALGVELDGIVLHHLESLLLQLLDGHKPLLGQPRLERVVAAVAVHDGVVMILDMVKQAQRLELRHHGLTRLPARHARELAEALYHMRRLVEDVDLLKAVALAHGEVVGVVSGGDLHAAGAEFLVDVEVGEHGDLAVDDGKHDLLAHQVLVALILRGDGHAGVAEHGLGTRGCHHDVLDAVNRLDKRVAKVPQVTLLILVLGLVIGDGGGAIGAPVDDALSAIHDAIVVPVGKHLSHGLGELGAHGELLVIVVARATHGGNLVHDGGAVFAPPLLARLDEGLTADLAAVDALVSKVLVNLGLRGDARMVGTEDPARLVTLHARAANAGVLNGVV